MKNILIIILSALLLLSVPATTFAGFTIKKTTASTETQTIVTNTPARHAALSGKQQSREAIKAVRSILLSQYTHPNGKGTGSGWAGIASFVCGMLGIVGLFTSPFLFLLSIPAIIIGAIGMGRRHINRGFAIAGFTLGVIAIFILVLAVIFVIAALGSL